MFTSDLNAGVVPQMSPPPHDLERLRKTMVDFIVLSIKLVFMVLGVSYPRVLAQRPTGCCSACNNNNTNNSNTTNNNNNNNNNLSHETPVYFQPISVVCMRFSPTPK